MDVFQLYHLSTAAYLTLQSLPLILTPKVLVSMLAAEPRRITDLESYLSRSLGLALLTLALLSLTLSGLVPFTTTLQETQPSKTDEAGRPKDPYAYPTVIVTTIYHALSAFYIYAQFAYRLGSFAFGTGLTFSAILFGLGLWVILFAGERGRVSKTTGADKRTGNFPFENKESAREKKREEKEKEKEREKSGKRRTFARSSSSRA